jgi:hypothetical protein
MPMSKIFKTIGIIFGLILFLAVFSFIFGGSESDNDTTTSNTDTQSSEVSSTVSNSTQTVSSEGIVNQTTALYDDTFSDVNRENVIITYLQEGNTVVIAEDVTDLETTVPDVVQLGIAKFVAICEKVFEGIPESESCLYSYDLTYTDSRGQERDGSPMNIIISREKWSEYNWDNLAFKPIVDTLIDDGIMVLDSGWSDQIKRDGVADMYIPIPQ